MRVLLMFHGDMPTGRGVLYRIVNVLPRLDQRGEIVCITLSEPDDSLRDLLRSLEVPLYVRPLRSWRWFVLDPASFTRSTVAVARRERIELVVLGWEIWDLMAHLSLALPREGIAFATVVHSLPFLGAPRQVRGAFWPELLGRIARERSIPVAAHLLLRAHQRGAVLKRTNSIVIHETTAAYLRGYFPCAPFEEAFPGNAIDVSSAGGQSRKEFDLVFMAKLVREKGIFEIPEILHWIRVEKPDARLLVIGDFDSRSDEHRFNRMLTSWDVEDGVEMAGWVSGDDRLARLSSAEVLVMPGRGTDTFSYPVLEGLACRLPAVVYDLPYARCMFPTPAVRRAPVGRRKLFAKETLQLLAQCRLREARSEAQAFVAGFPSWTDVADAEFAAYERILARS